MAMKRFYDLYKHCLVNIIVKNSTGDYVHGAGFHIGDGYLVTARHLIENYSIESVKGGRFADKNFTIKRIFYPSNPLIDLALLETDFSLGFFMEKVTITDTEGHSEQIEPLLVLLQENNIRLHGNSNILDGIGNPDWQY